MFDTVLVANRGEIAVRIFRTLRSLGIRSVAVYSDADAGARHVREADVAVRLGPAAARDSYLNIARVLDAVAATGAQAVHPGYGFLAENAEFARACAEAGAVFVGPPAHAVEVMGDKIRAKRAVSAAGVPVVPGRTDLDMGDDELVSAAGEIGYPVLIKPSAGGGGKGMRLVERPEDLRSELVGARREAMSAFGDDTLFVERFVTDPRHIEVQVMADTHGTVVHLGERECSLQRRHQKVVEEAPSPAVDAATRARIGAAAVETARSVGYTGAGTVEFIASGRDGAVTEFFFMEMNTRLQVEHPVTELVTGLDLVELQLRVAAGERLPFAQDDVTLTGHAVEARVYAEDPARGFLPTGGRVLAVREPAGAGIRVDSSLLADTEVGSTYDPMLAKVIAWAPDRDSALSRLRTALAETAVLGVVTNLDFLHALVADPDVRAGRLDTGLIERRLDELTADAGPGLAPLAWAMSGLLARNPSFRGQGAVVDPWSVADGWRIGAPAVLRRRVSVRGGEPLDVVVTGSPDAATVVVGDNEPVHATAVPRSDTEFTLVADGIAHRVTSVTSDATTWLWVDGVTASVTELVPERRGRTSGPASGQVRSPMPGAVVAVHVSAGDSVTKGTPMLVVEAMKMEHTLVAPLTGTVTELGVRAGDQVVVDQQLAVVTGQDQA